MRWDFREDLGDTKHVTKEARELIHIRSQRNRLDTMGRMTSDDGR